MRPTFNVDFRKSKVKWIGMNPDTRWLFDKISWLIAHQIEICLSLIFGDIGRLIQYTIYYELVLTTIGIWI